MILEKISEGVLKGNINLVLEEVKSLIEKGEEPLKIINEGLMVGMNSVGEKFKKGEMFVPEVLMSAKAMKSGIELVKPLINDEDMPSIGTVVIGTVKGDLHDIGKNLVGMMMESSGFKVINIGVDASPDKFVEAVKENNANIVAISAMLTTTMINMKKVVEAIKEEGLKDNVKIMIGGAPLTEKFAEEIDVDLYAVDAYSAVEKVKKLIE